MVKISIITPLYNGSKTLLETANSVFEQEFKDWEWVLFDDGSQDDTQIIARNLAANNENKIFYYEHYNNENFGTSFTRNRAVEKSHGEIISFLDQDDIWYKNRLSHHIEIFDSMKECAMIWSPSLFWYKERSYKQSVKYGNRDLESGLYNSPEFIEIFLSDLKGNPLPSSTLVRKKHFNEVKGYEETIKGSEDIVLWLKIAEKFSIYYEDKVLIKYRKHPESTLRKAAQSGQMNEWNLTFYRWVIDFLKRNSARKKLIEENEFAYYICLKRVAAKNNYYYSRRNLLKGLTAYPDLKKNYLKDFLLDVILPFEVATKISAKIRFDWLRNN